MRRIERRFGKFERSLRVPGGLDPDAIDAAMADGVLTLRIPKPESANPHRASRSRPATQTVTSRSVV
jgi:HSP20 family protein